MTGRGEVARIATPDELAAEDARHERARQLSGAELARSDERRLVRSHMLGDLQAVKDLIAPNASEPELRVFAAVAVDLGLDPFAGQICLIGRWSRDVGRTVYRHQITVAGRRLIADRTGRLRGIDGPVWCGPRRHAEDGSKLPLEWSDVWDDDEATPYAARCLVYVAGWDHAANGTAKWSEFAQTDRDGHLTPTWAQMPSHMLGKVAEALALRRGFPEVASAVAYRDGWPDDAGGRFEVDDAVAVAEAAPEVPVAVPLADVRPDSGAAAPGSRRPVERRRRPDEVPVEVYDNEPEAQGYGPADPGRPFA
jgi:RecT family protein